MSNIVIVDSGPGATESEIRNLEKLIRCELPSEYRVWLREFDGGRPEPSYIDIPKYYDGVVGVQVIFGLHRRVESSRLGWVVESFSSILERGYLPIARTDGDDLFLLSLSGERRGHVLFQEYMAQDEVWHVVDTFQHFLAACRSWNP